MKMMPEGKGKLRSREEKQENRAGLRKLEDVKCREKRKNAEKEKEYKMPLVTSLQEVLETTKG